MKRNIYIFSVLLIFALCSTLYGICPEQPNDHGNCDTMYVEPWPEDIPVQEQPPFFVRVPIYVTNDLASPGDSIAAFVIPLCYTHSNQAKYCSLSSYWNKTDFSGLRSIFRHLGTSAGDTVINRMMWLFQQGGGREWNTRILNLDGTSHFWLTLMISASQDQRWWEGSRTLLATMTFKMEDSMHICIDSCFWPPGSQLAFTRSGGGTYIPRLGTPHDSASYKVCFPVYVPDHNVSVNDILAPVDTVPINVPLQPQVILQNKGRNVESGSVLFEIEPVYLDTLDFNIESGEIDTVEFSMWNPSEPASYISKCDVNLPGDEVPRDDTLSKRIFVSAGYGPEIHRVPTIGISGHINTVTVYGSRFEPGMTARLMLTGEQDILADTSQVSFINDTTICMDFDLTGAVVDYWDIEVTNSSNQSYRFYKGFRVNFYDGELLPFCDWTDFIVHDGSTIVIGGVLVPKTNDVFMLLKKSNRIGYAGTWAGTVMVYSPQGGCLAIESSYDDVAFQIQNPSSGLHTLKIDAYDPGEGKVMFCSALPSITLGQWYLGEILRPYGTDWVQFDLPPDQDTLRFQTEGFGMWSTLDVYYGSICNPTQHWQFLNWGFGYHIEGQIPSPPAGRYYVKYMDSAVLQGTDDQTRQYLLFVDANAITTPPPLTPTITGLSTYSGSQSPITIVVYGTGFDSAATASLIREGFDDIVPSYIYVDSVGMRLSAMFDLSSAQPGDWRLMVINSDGASDTAATPFSIESNGESDLWLNILGRNEIRIGRWSTYRFAYGNAGNKDAINPVIWIKIPQGYKYQSDLPLVCPTEDSISPANILIIPLRVFAGTRKEFTLRLYTLDPAPASIEAGIITLPAEIPDKAKLLTPAESGLTMSHKVTPKPGDFVFHYFYKGGRRIPIGHNGIYVEEGGKKYVIDFVDVDDGYDPPRKNAVRRTEFDAWKNMNAPNTYIGSARNWDQQQLGNQIAAEAINRWQKYEDGQRPWKYFPIPVFGCENCFSWAAKIVNDVAGQTIIPYSPFKWPRTSFNEWGGIPEISPPTMEDEPSTIPVDRPDSSDYMGFTDSLTNGAPIDASQDITGVGSLTPEDKYGVPGFDQPQTPLDSLIRFVRNDREFLYCIDFWNYDSATAPAQIVFVEDTLDADFEITSFGFTDFGFLRWNVPLDGTQYFNVNVDMRPDDSLIVNVEGTFDPDHRTIRWVFRSLDPITGQPPEDPMAGFLPPIDSMGYNIGWVDFKVNPKPNLLTGTQLTNQAFVNFDSVGGYNPAPKERPFLNTIDAGTPTSYIHLLPDTNFTPYFTVTWSGADDSGGSGIAYYSIYHSKDSEPYTSWIANTTDTSASFTGESGHTYYFYSIARDNVGHVETAPDSFDARTVVYFDYVCGDVNDNNVVDLGDVVYLITYLYKSGPPPQPLEAADVTMNGEVNIGDVVYLITYQYKNGPPPCNPSPEILAKVKPPLAEIGLRTSPAKEGQVSIFLDAKFGVEVAGAQFGIEWDKEKLELLNILPTERSQKLQTYYSTATTGEVKLGMVDINGKEYIKAGEGSLIEFKMKSKTDSLDVASLQIKEAILVDPYARNLDVRILGKPGEPNLPKEFSLSQNYPNPFNPQTVIQYALPHDCKVEIAIYNILGQKVKTLVNEHQKAGYKRVEWDGKNDSGGEVASGIYFYRIEAGKFTQSKKMVILK